MPANRLQEITGLYIGAKYARDGFVIARIRVTSSADDRLPAGRECVIKGNAIVHSDDPDEPDELLINHEYRFYGRVEVNEFRGKPENQFAFSMFVQSVPASREAVIRYLQQAPHIGSRIAIALWDAFKSDAVRTLREQPEVAAAATKLSDHQAVAAAARLREMQALEATTMEMMELLSGYGLPRTTAMYAIRKWGVRAPEFIKRNPYLLMAFRGCGFLKADGVYKAQGLPLGALKRQVFCAWHALASDSEGHTWHPLAVAIAGIRANVDSAELQPDKAIAVARRAGLLAVYTDAAGKEWATDARKARAEDRLAGLVAAAMEEESPWGPVLESRHIDAALAPLTDHQRERLLAALRGPISILGGGPGTGKTFTAACLIRAIVAACGENSVAICAPTGKAAVRLTEAMAEYKLPLRARTTHSLLKVESADDGSGTWGFAHNENNPLPFRYMIADEESMKDVPLAAALFAARSRGTAVLLIGDIHQLPPVGHGAPLRDLIDAGIPYGELVEVKRNAGAIVEACKAIRAGEKFVTYPKAMLDIASEPPRNLIHAPASSPTASVQEVLSLIRGLREGVNAGGSPRQFDPIWDCQIVVAVNAKSALGRVPLNKLLQAELNPEGQRCEGSPFRVGDKVICLKNQFLPIADLGNDDKPKEGEQAFVANGEFGRVVRVEPKRTIVIFENPTRRILIRRGKQEGDEAGGKVDDKSSSAAAGCAMDLGYAATCHKMQGSQAPVVIVVLDEYPGASGKFGVAKREWLTTANSRAESLCYLVGKMSTATKIMAERSLPNRKTFLAERLQEARIWGSWSIDAIPAMPAVESSTYPQALSPPPALEAAAHGPG